MPALVEYILLRKTPNMGPVFQSELFPAGRMMEDRLGRKLFDSFPHEPGIYRFYDQTGMLLYVGKAADLRKRLASYRRARAGRVPRKVGELVSRIHRIETEVHTSADEALLAENQWIRRMRPPYNHANKHTETYYYIIMGREHSALTIRLSMSMLPEEDGVLRFGCFKGHIRVRRMLGSLLQLLWLAINRPSSPHYLPVQLTRRITPLEYRLSFDHNKNDKLAPDLIELNGDASAGSFGTGITSFADADTRMVLAGLRDEPDIVETLTLIRAWFDGQSDYLLHHLAWWNRRFCVASSFNRLYMEAALEGLDQFYRTVLIPHRRMRDTWLNGRTTIGRDELDDLIVALAATDRRAETLKRRQKLCVNSISDITQKS